jgi:hypothetical protein
MNENDDLDVPQTTGLKTRQKKINPKLRAIDEETKHQIKLSRLSALEEDEEIQKEEYFDLILAKVIQITKWRRMLKFQLIRAQNQ